jgi:predicted dehydrogenase/nucleoside-diphosphate-sugar epimerase
MPPLRIAIVGAGKMAQHHARTIVRHDLGATVSAIVDPSPAAREAMAVIVPTAAGFASLGEALRAGPIDVVHIVTPPATHEALAQQAIDAGCHVYIEKPFVATTLAAERLFAAARTRGLVLAAGHQLLFEPPARRALALLPALGHVAHIESYFSFRPTRRTPDGRAPLRADHQLLDILPHPVYLLLAFLEAAREGRTELASLEIGAAGTVHALFRRGDLTGVLVVTLEGRPVESYVRVVGRNGSVFADFVRSTVQRQIGPGTSGIDKLLAPYALSRQLLTGTTSAMTRRVARRQRSYPGLAELFGAFYESARTAGVQPPLTREGIIETVRVWEEVARRIDEMEVAAALVGGKQSPRVVVTGGTGLLGRAVVRALTRRGIPTAAIGRRTPPSWDRVPGAAYLAADLARPEQTAAAFAGAEVVIHCAAETAGSWDQHQANSIDATVNTMRAAAAAGVRRFIHVSSLAVVAPPSGAALSESSPLYADSRTAGPYVWGKLESERQAEALARELGLALTIVRPGALVDYAAFDPPGRLGRRLGNFFVAVGSPGQRVGVADVGFAGEVLAWMVDHPAETPAMLHLLEPDLPTKRELLDRLRAANPDLSVVWLPWPVLVVLSGFGIVLQKLLRPSRPAMHVAKAFAPQRLDTSAVRRVRDAMQPDRVTPAVHAPRAAVTASTPDPGLA